MRTDRDARYALTSLYYYVTPLFITADYLWGYNVRVSLLDAYPAYPGTLGHYTYGVSRLFLL
jgi:hypothetical protein